MCPALCARFMQGEDWPLLFWSKGLVFSLESLCIVFLYASLLLFAWLSVYCNYDFLFLYASLLLFAWLSVYCNYDFFDEIMILQWSSSQTGGCETFEWGGCKGNENKYEAVSYSSKLLTKHRCWWWWWLWWCWLRCVSGFPAKPSARTSALQSQRKTIKQRSHRWEWPSSSLSL